MRNRGYVLMIVLVLGVVLASLAGSLLYATARDHTEASLQTSSVQAVYASEAAVAVGVERLRSELEDTVTPNLTRVEEDSRAAAALALPGVTFPTLTVRYFDGATNATSPTPFGNASLSTITSGPNTGLRAQQTPIQVFAVASVENAVASVADAMRIDLIPVFQFAMFFDGDFELLNPAAMTISGRVHTNRNFYVSGGFENRHHIEGVVTVAGKLHGRSATQEGFRVVDFDILKSNGTQLNISSSFPFSGDNQRSNIAEWGGTVSDSSTGAQPLTIPLRMTSVSACTSSSACGAGRSCVRVRPTDAAGVCTTNVVSRPDVCGDTSKRASFEQSLAVELIRRPVVDYANSGVLAPYQNVERVDSSGRHITSPYAVDFGPKPALASIPTQFNDYLAVGVERSVPRVASDIPEDDPGARLDRMYWKADVRIIDGVWYRKGRVEPIFDPESDGYLATQTPDVNDKRHKYARVLRYSWWWDSRESRAYCSSSSALHENCVQSGGRYQRGLQIRATDFDMAAFMALLEDSSAALELFPQGLPGDGVVVYVSETFDPSFEDSSTALARTANVRNFLNFPTMHNHISSAAEVSTAFSLSGRRDPNRNSAVGANPPTPYQLGWLPENIWGRRAPTNFESLTRPLSPSNYRTHVPAGTGALSATLKNGSSCALPSVDFASSAALRPASRPSSFATPVNSAPCIRGAVTPLGPENAVRFVRGHSVPAGGFTFVTDNRLYVQGDVNVRNNSGVVSGGYRVFQDIPGSVSFVADSVTLVSSRMSEMQFQGPLDAFHRGPAQYTNLRQWSADASAAPGFQAGIVPYDGTATAGAAFGGFCAMQAVAPFEMFLNASLLMGDVPACIDAGAAIGNNGGGVNNFPRFVEHWGFNPSSPVPLHINGSMVSLFRSEQGNSRFVNASYGTFSTARGSAYSDGSPCIYTPPERRWVFDNTLLQGIENLPPGTPRVVATDRMRWVRR